MAGTKYFKKTGFSPEVENYLLNVPLEEFSVLDKTFDFRGRLKIYVLMDFIRGLKNE